MEKTRSGGIELGEFVSTARSTNAHDGIFSLLPAHHSLSENVSLRVFESRRCSSGLICETSSRYAGSSLFIPVRAAGSRHRVMKGTIGVWPPTKCWNICWMLTHSLNVGSRSSTFYGTLSSACPLCDYEDRL